MDVNALLARIRAIMSELTIARDVETSAWLGAQLADSVRDLDEWLSGGGFLPTEWATDPNAKGMDNTVSASAAQVREG